MPWADQHCHLPADHSAAEVVADARDAGVEVIINVGTTVAGSARAADVAAAHDGVWSTAGVHPHDASDGVEGLEALLGRREVVAVGETGLDYHYDHSPRPSQREVFAAQVEMANRHDVPLVVHTRSAWDDTLAVLDREGVPRRTVMHCFTGGPAEAEECLGRGAILSFSGIITFPNAAEVRSAARLCPVDRLMVETDSPFLAPVPCRGRPNRPALVGIVGAAVAQAKDMEVAEVEAATWKTTLTFYGIAGSGCLDGADA